jgi:hypothetical protein
MARTAFDKPVVVYFPERHGGSVRAEVHDTREAIALMTKHRLGGYDLDGEVWATTFSLLTRAALHPTPQNIRVAQLALEVLASETATRH